MLFLAHWARKLSWQETAVCIFAPAGTRSANRSSMSCSGGLIIGNWDPIVAIGVDGNPVCAKDTEIP